MTFASLEAPSIRYVSWAPQNDVLGDPSVKAFITHGGSNSMYESAFHGVPVVCIPIMGDQLDNAAKVSWLHASASSHILMAMHTSLSSFLTITDVRCSNDIRRTASVRSHQSRCNTAGLHTGLRQLQHCTVSTKALGSCNSSKAYSCLALCKCLLPTGSEYARA